MLQNFTPIIDDDSLMPVESPAPSAPLAPVAVIEPELAPESVSEPAPAPPVGAVVTSAPIIQERTSFRRPETRVTDVGKDPATWTWEDLRNYVVRSIERIHGPFPRFAPKENAIFKAFASRWGDQAGPIAVFAFEACQGRWHTAPIGVSRFAKVSDEYFAAPIAQRLSE